MKLERQNMRKLVCIIAVVLIIALAGANVYQYLQIRMFKNHSDTLIRTYSTEYLHLNSITVKRFEQMKESGEDFLVSIGRPTCGDCRAFEPTFVRIVEELDMAEQIYYLNVAEVRKDDDAWAAFKQAHEITYTPTFARYSGGRLVSLVECDNDDCVSEDEVREWMRANRK